MSVRFSILIPAYKSSFFAECIESVLSQSFCDFEVIIVNDNSPEDLGGILSAFDDPRIHYYINDKNCGAENVVDTWNQCLNLSTGEYVICMGDDDKLLPDCLQEYDNLLMQYPGIGLLHGWTEMIDEESNIIALTTHRCNHETAMSLLWHRTYAYHAQFIGDFCFRAETLKKNGGFYKLPLAWASDDISAVIAAREHGVANTQKVVFQYRRHSKTISNSSNAILKIEAINAKETWLNSYLSTPCDNPDDELYRQELANEIPSIINKEKSLQIYFDLKSHSIFRCFYWIGHRKLLNIHLSAIVRACLKLFA